MVETPKPFELPKTTYEAYSAVINDTYAPIAIASPDSMANICVVPSTRFLINARRVTTKMECDTVGEDTQVTHIGTARFTALDKHGELRTFDVPDFHVIPSCKKILIGNDAESHGTYYVQPDNDEWYLRIPCSAHLPVTRTANDLVGLVCIPNAMGTKAAGSSKLAMYLVQRARLAGTASRYVRRILRRHRSGYASAKGTGRAGGIYFDNNSIAAETYNQHSPHVDQYGSMAEVLKR
jgi:hypothetical protein